MQPFSFSSWSKFMFAHKCNISISSSTLLFSFRKARISRDLDVVFHRPEQKKCIPRIRRWYKHTNQFFCTSWRTSAFPEFKRLAFKVLQDYTSSKYIPSWKRSTSRWPLNNGRCQKFELLWGWAGEAVDSNFLSDYFFWLKLSEIF